MSKDAPIVAELGRPETVQETADRKAESSRIYRSSQTFRNLIAALIATIGVVVVIVLSVPRGEPVAQPPIDLAGIAKNAATSLDRPVIVPEPPEGWRVTAAEVTGGAVTVWNVTLAPTADDERGFLKLGQAADADRVWAAALRGAQPSGTVDVGGVDWDVYKIAKPEASGNVSYALGTQAGTDYVLLYGSRSADDTAAFAKTLVPQIRILKENR
ncbi:DUF4245 domain-containing protein [Microbacterium sp. KUDC0406]|uniref:DUF4245 family protein n=1 Tax=Microbacterium sp. KUDC0406 TaxID=2909588 RepID=UPI001F2BA911|nr:DUF4245 family protein [Microbacterium sp. KUDC0406]UJP11603.1 DUF4245 domain-containing protein [Microbacterium sp. KUDC0406]